MLQDLIFPVREYYIRVAKIRRLAFPYNTNDVFSITEPILDDRELDAEDLLFDIKQSFRDLSDRIENIKTGKTPTGKRMIQLN